MANSIEAKTKEQGDLVRKLKSENASKEIIQEEVAKLKALKLELGPVEQKPKGNDKPKPVVNPEMEAKVKELGDLVRKLKAEKASKEDIDEAVDKLKNLKLQHNPSPRTIKEGN